MIRTMSGIRFVWRVPTGNRDGFDVMQMKSYCYTCEIDERILGERVLKYDSQKRYESRVDQIPRSIKHNLDYDQE